MRLVVRRAVGDRGGGEDDYVGEVTLTQEAAAVEAKIGRRQVRRLADRGFEGQQLLVADVLAQKTRERPVGPRVRHRLQEVALRSLRRRVRTETHPRQRD